MTGSRFPPCYCVYKLRNSCPSQTGLGPCLTDSKDVFTMTTMFVKESVPDFCSRVDLEKYLEWLHFSKFTVQLRWKVKDGHVHVIRPVDLEFLERAPDLEPLFDCPDCAFGAKCWIARMAEMMLYGDIFMMLMWFMTKKGCRYIPPRFMADFPRRMDVCLALTTLFNLHGQRERRDGDGQFTWVTRQVMKTALHCFLELCCNVTGSWMSITEAWPHVGQHLDTMVAEEISRLNKLVWRGSWIPDLYACLVSFIPHLIKPDDTCVVECHCKMCYRICKNRRRRRKTK